MDRYRSVGGKPAEYLLEGEALVHHRETLLTLAGESLYDELAGAPPESRSIKVFFDQIPARRSWFSTGVLSASCLDWWNWPRLQAGRSWRKATVCCRPERDGNVYRSTHGFRTSGDFTFAASGPSELREQNIRAYWFRQPTEQIKIEEGQESLLLWTRFPDMRFMDTHAASAALFDSIWDMLETVWMRTVQKVPPSRPVLVTSDHGYIFLGPSLSEPRLDGIDRPLEGKRFRSFPQQKNCRQKHAVCGLILHAVWR